MYKIFCNDFFWSSASHQTTVLHGIDPVAVCCCNIQIMQSTDHSDPKTFYNIQKLELVFDVKMVGRLIQDQTVSFLCQSSCQNDSLLLTARQTWKNTVPIGKHSHFFQTFFHDLIILGIIPFHGFLMRSPSHHYNFLYGKFKIIVVVLGHHCQCFCRILYLIFVQRFSIQHDHTGIWLQYTVNTFQQCTFSTSVWSYNSYKFLFLYGCVNSLKNLISAKLHMDIRSCQFHDFSPPNP